MTVDAAGTDWMRHAACTGADDELFFPTRGGARSGDAKAICRRCPVREACLDFAITMGPHYTGGGVWGGMGSTERARESRRRRLTATTR